MRLMTIAILMLTLSACETAKTRGGQVYDKGLEEAEFFICRAASVGSVMRRYGSSIEKAQAWKTLCATNPDAVDGLLGVKRAPEREG